jgi:hypothetical protein
MALTLESEQRLTKVSLVKHFEDSQAKWTALAKQSYQFVEKNFPNGATVRPDDVAKALGPLLEVNEDLASYLETNKLGQKYWIRDFGDLILDRTWDKISKGAN